MSSDEIMKKWKITNINDEHIGYYYGMTPTAALETMAFDHGMSYEEIDPDHYYVVEVDEDEY